MDSTTGESKAYTLITNRGYGFNNLIFAQNLARSKEVDTLSAYRGLIGNRPEMFFNITLTQSEDFVNGVNSIASVESWAAFKKRFGFLRNDPQTWTQLDWFEAWNRQHDPLEAGAQDMSRYDIQDQFD